MAEIDSDQRHAFRTESLGKGDELYETAYLNSLTAEDLLRMVPVNKSKLADTTRVTVTAVAIDPDLQLTVEANSRWKVTGLLSVVGESANGDFDYTLSGPAGVGGVFHSGTNTRTAVGTEVTQATDATAILVPIQGIITVGATAGAIGLFWAQNASHADDQILQAGSYLSFARMLNS